jgi:hypothetical protein
MLRELGLFLNAATATNVGLIRSANSPVATTSVVGASEDSGDPVATAVIATAWSTAPTIGTVYLAKWAIPATVNAGVIVPFPYGRGIVVANPTDLVLWNFGASACSVINGYMVWEE